MGDTQAQSGTDVWSSCVENQHKVLKEISTATVFEYDFESRQFSLLVNTTHQFGMTEPELVAYIKSCAYTSVEALLSDFVHKDDLATAQEAHAMLTSRRPARYMARIKYASGTYLWRNIFYCINIDHKNGRQSIFGYVADLHDTKTCKGIIEHFIYAVDPGFLCLDINTDCYVLFGVREHHSPILDIGSNYSRSIVEYVNRYVAPEGRERCLAQMQTSRVAEVLQTSAHHILNLDFRDPVVGNSRKSLKYSYYDRERGLVLVSVADQTRQFADELEYAKIIKDALSQASTDPLTGLYNRHSGEALVAKMLASSTAPLHALMLLHIARFESVGESFGEAVLADVALRLKRLFRSNDVLARVGDTQFMAFMADVTDETVAVRKVEDIQRLLWETFTEPQEHLRLSCNVGLTFIKGRPGFDAILHNVHSSLHRAMQAGENHVHIYQEDGLRPCLLPAVTEPEESRTSLVLQLKERIFEILYSTPDFEQSVHMALALIGGMLNVSRVYVFENSADSQTTSNTFEWCNETVSSEIHKLQNLPFSSTDYAALFDGNGLFNCPDISATRGPTHEILSMQGIHSLLQVAIKDGNEVIGFVGFDECRSARLFTAVEIDTLSFVAKIIGTFVRKKRMTDLGSMAVRDKVQALDNLPSYIYVLDSEYRLLYMNKMVKMLVPGALVGMKCHSSLKGLDEPCPGCPAQRCEQGRCSVEMYNPRYNLWVISSASKIAWGGQENTVLISCQDITSFKIMRAMA